MAISVIWWVYVLVCVILFAFIMAAHFIMKKFNEARYEVRIQRLYATYAATVQVSPPLLDIESRKQLSKYSKQHKRFNKHAEGISLIYTKEQNRAKAFKILSDKAIMKCVKSGKGLKCSSDDLESKRSKVYVKVDEKDKACSTPHLPMATTSHNDEKSYRTTSENIIKTEIDINEDLDKQTEQVLTQEDNIEEILVTPSKLDLEKEDVESLRNDSSRIYTYSNFLGSIYSSKIGTHILDNATTSKSLTRSELNDTSEYEVLTINPVDDRSTCSKATGSTVDKESQKHNSQINLLPDDIKKSVSFKVNDKDLKDEENIEKVASTNDMASSETSVSTSNINNANDHPKEDKNIVVKIAKTPDLSSTSKVSFKPESVTIYIDNSDSDTALSESLENKDIAKYNSHVIKSSSDDNNLEYSSRKLDLNAICESFNIYFKESFSIKSLKHGETDSSSNHTATTDQTLRPSSSNYAEETMKPHASSADTQDNAKRSVSVIKFDDIHSGDDSNCDVSKRLSPDRVRRSASRVTFVDEVVSISTGNIFRINSQTNTISRTSPQSDSFERDSRGSFLDEMVFYKYKLDQKLDKWLKEEEASTSRRNDTYFMNQMVLNRLQFGDTRDFECIASESNINDATRKNQRPIHETVSLDRSDFSSTKSIHDFKKVKDNKNKKSKGKDE